MCFKLKYNYLLDIILDIFIDLYPMLNNISKNVTNHINKNITNNRSISSIENINFDIFYKILQYLDPCSVQNVLISSKNCYMYNQQVQLLLTKKIINHFDILKDIPFKFVNEEHNLILYKFLNSLNYFYKNQEIRLINVLIHYIHFKVYSIQNVDMSYLREHLLYIFKFLIIKYHSNIYGEELYYLSKYMIAHIIDYCSINELDIMLENIKISHQSISIYFDYISHHIKIDAIKINKIFNYLCWKHFFGFQNNDIAEIDAHNILLSKMIKIYEYRIFYNNIVDDVIHITNNILEKQQKYHFVFDYQKLFNICLTNNSHYYLNIIINSLNTTNLKRQERNLHQLYITVTKNDIKLLIENKFLNLLKLIIDIHLGSLINLSIYINTIHDCLSELSQLDLLKVKFCLQPYLTNYNYNLLFNKDLC